MVHGLALQLVGALTMTSEVGLGANVELWLPRSATEPAAAGRTEGPTNTGVARGVVLLIDNEELVRASTADMLIDLGYIVVEADSA